MILSKKEFNELKNQIKSYFEKKKIEVIFRDDYKIELPKGDKKKKETSILNLVKICKEAEKERWNELIKEFFEILTEADDFDEIFEERKYDYDFMKEYISVRFWPEGFLVSDSDKSFIFMPLLEDVCLTVTFDFPKYTKNVLPEFAKTWRKNEKELFKIGYMNIKNKYQ